MRGKFLAFSSEVTAFSVFELEGTGQADAYFAAVQSVVGAAVLEELLDAYAAVRHLDDEQRPHALRREIFGDEKLGPIARNVVKLWYAGIWYQLPRSWTLAFGAREKDTTFTVSASAYPEGLMWRAVGAHPPGAKAPGYGSWAEPPTIPGLEAERQRPPVPSSRRLPLYPEAPEESRRVAG